MDIKFIITIIFSMIAGALLYNIIETKTDFIQNISSPLNTLNPATTGSGEYQMQDENEEVMQIQQEEE